MHRLLILDKRNRENWLININPAAQCRALCPGRMSAWHLLPLPKQAGKWERGNQPGQRQWELLSSSALGPVIPQVTPAWGERPGTLPGHFKSWMGIGFFPHVLSSMQLENRGAGGGAVATGMSVRALPKGHVPSTGVCWGSPAHPYGMVLCHSGPQSKTVLCDSITSGVWHYS